MEKGVVYLIVFAVLAATVSADLSAFPSSFNERGSFDGLIVIGEGGSAKDYQAAVELAIALQYDLSSSAAEDKEPVFQIRDGNDILTTAEPLQNVVKTLSSSELPLLANHTFTNQFGTFEYSQFLTLGPTAATGFGYTDGIPENEDDIPQTYLEFPEGVMAYEYQAVFPTLAKSRIGSSSEDYALLDIEDKSITFLGKEYFILDVQHPENDSISMVLLGGSIEDILGEYEQKTYTLKGNDYDINVIGIFYSDNDLKVQLKVNGEVSEALGVGSTHTLIDGTIIGIKTLLENEGSEPGGSDMVQFYLGADKLTLIDGNVSDRNYSGRGYVMGSTSIEGTDVRINGVDRGIPGGEYFFLESISVKWTPEENHYILMGESLLSTVQIKDQVFTRTFDLVYVGANDDIPMEAIELVPEGRSRYRLKMYNKLGEFLEIPLFYTGLTRFGDSSHTTYVVEGTNISTGSNFLVTSDGYRPLPTPEGVTHLIRYDAMSKSGNSLRFTNLATEESITVSYEDGATSLYLPLGSHTYLVSFSDLGDSTDIRVDLDNSGTITAGEKPALVTMNGMVIDLETNPITTYAYKRLTLYSKPKASALGIDTLNQYLYSSIGPAIQAGYNANFGAFGLNITSNPVLDDNATTEVHDSIRITITEADSRLDVSNVERCIDGANPKQVKEAVTTAYDGLIAVYNGMGFLPYPTLGGNIYASFMDSVCYPYATTTLRFMWDIGDTDDQRGGTTYAQIVELTGKDSGPDSVTIISPGQELEHIVTVGPVVSETPEESTSTSGKISGSVLDSELKAVKNLLVVGGPCANKVAREIMGVTGECTAGFEQGKGRITFGEYHGKNAIIISGYRGEDTLNAAKALADHKRYGLMGKDLQVINGAKGIEVGPYVFSGVVETISQPSVEAAAELPLTPIQDPVQPAVEQPKVLCSHPNLASGEFSFKVKKMGITREVTATPVVETNGLSGSINFIGGETFKAQMGVDWLQYVLHVHKGDCSGEEIYTATMRWLDGEGDKTEAFTLPSAGCYCIAVRNGDLSIDDADISLEGDEMEVMFGAA